MPAKWTGFFPQPMLRVRYLFVLLCVACGQAIPAPTLTATTSWQGENFSAPPVAITATPVPATSPVPDRKGIDVESRPTPTATRLPRRSVVLVSWDGARSDLIEGWMNDGTLPHFADLAERGGRAEYSQSVDPSLTAPAHSSLASGVFPNQTGIVSNRFHNPNDSFYWYRQAFDEAMSDSEPLWVAAAQAGLSTAAVFFPGCSPAIPSQMADYTVGFGEWEAYSSQQTVTLSPVADVSGLPQSFSPPLAGEFTIPSVARIVVVAFDTLDDGQVAYDRVALARAAGEKGLALDPQADLARASLGVGEWGELVVRPQPLAGADVLIQTISAREVVLYHSAVYRNAAAPRSLLQALEENFGYFPAGADAYALEHDWIEPEDFMHMLDRAAQWRAAVTAWVYAEYQPDLLLAWQDVFDAAGHAFLCGDDPRQASCAGAAGEQSAAMMQRSAGIADAALAQMMAPVDLQESTLLLVGDHGMAPVHSLVYINRVLEQSGWLKLDRRDYVVVDKSSALAFASGGAANIYINLEGRERDGIVPVDEYEALQDAIISALSAVTDPQTGEAVFSRLLRKQELAALGLEHLHSGDIFVQAAPGYAIDGWRGHARLFEAATLHGQHGYDSTLPEMRSIGIFAGHGIPQTGAVIPAVRIVDYAPTIARLLGFELHPNADPDVMQGRLIPALVDP